MVVVDTNILWHKDKTFVVNPDFDSFWDSHSNRFALTLAVPHVVRGELLFQQTMSALKSLGRANQELEEAARVAAVPYRHRVTDTRIKKDVERRLARWLKRRKAQVLTVPFTSIMWSEFAEAAIWRRGPFTPDPKTPEAEKGFRDALILETVAELVSAPPADCQVAFLCNDNLLRGLTDQRLATSTCFSSFESIADFTSYLRLSQEKLTQAFVRAIRSRARAKFFTKDDPSCLYTSERIVDTIRRDFLADFIWFGDHGVAGITPIVETSFFTSLTRTPEWTEASREIVWLGNPEFTRLEGERDLHWSSTVTFVQLFRQQLPSMILASSAAPEERLRVLAFTVAWHSVVRGDGRFQTVALTGISRASKTFTQATPEELRRYRISPSAPAPPDLG